MADNTDIIREFLVSLGFQVDQAGAKKFTSALDGTGKTALVAGKAILGVAAAAEAMVIAFSSSMEKLYFASQRTGASVGNIKALDLGFRQVGISGGVALETLERMASAVRMNPGIRAFMDSILGKDTGNMDQAEAMLQLVEKMASLPHFSGAQYMQNYFGMDEKTFLMLKQGLPELREAQAKALEMQRKLGVDPDQAAKDGHELQQIWRDILNKTDTVAMKWMHEVMPHAKQFASYIDHALDRLANIKLDAKLEATLDFFKTYMSGPAQAGEALQKGDVVGAAGAMIKNAPGTVVLRKAAEYVKDNVKVISPEDRRTSTGKIKYPTPPAAKSEAPADLFARLERQYNLPMGLLDRVWKRESGRGVAMLSPKGAMGHFGFMPNTAREYGLKNPYDLAESANAAARKWSDLLKQYGGDMSKAAAAYNWGDGNLAKHGMNRAPFETRQYVADIAGLQSGAGKSVTLNQKTEINVTGGDSAPQTARSIMFAQDDVNISLARNLAGAFR